MANRDVKFIIRAQNEASREIDAITDALSKFTTAQDKASSSGDKLDDVINKVASEYEEFTTRLAGLQTLSKLTSTVDKAGASLNSLRSDFAAVNEEFATNQQRVSKTESELASLRGEQEKLSGLMKRQKEEADQYAVSLGRQSAAMKELRDARREYNAAMKARDGSQASDERVVNAAMRKSAAEAAIAPQRALNEEMRATRELSRELGVQVTALERNFRKEEAALENSRAKQSQLNEELNQGQARFDQMSSSVRQFGQALGQTSTEQGELSASMKRLAPEAERIGKLMASMQRQSTGGGSYVDSRLASSMRKQREEIEKTESAWKSIEAEIARVQKSIASGSGSSADQRYLNELIRAARSAKQEFDSNMTSLHKLQGVARSTFAEYVRGNASLDSVNKTIAVNAAAQEAALNSLAEAVKRYSTGLGTVASPEIASQLQRQAAAVEQARSRWQLLTNEANRLGNALRASGGGTAEQARNFNVVAGAAREAEAEFRRLNVELNRLNAMSGGNFFSRFNRESRQAMSISQRLRGEILSLVTSYLGLYAAIQNVGGVITAFQTLEAAQNRLGAVFNQDEGLVGEELGWVENQAKRLGIEFGSLSNQYSKFAVSANAANFSAEATRKIFLGVAEAGRVNKLSLDDMNGIFLALTQMIQKGRISSEELRQQLGERLPGAINIMADALGVSTAELAKMMENGEVLANQSNLLKFAEQLDKRFGSQLAKSLSSTTTLIGKFFNNIFQAQLLVADGGFIESFNVALEKMNTFFESREGRDFFLSIGAAAGNAVDVLTFLGENINIVVFAVQALVGIKLTSWLVGAATSVGALATNLENTGKSTVGLNRSLKDTVGNLNGVGPAIQTINSNVQTTAVNMQAAGRETTSWSRISVAASGAVATGLTTLSRTMNVVRGAAAAMWVAVGGWPGVIISAVTTIGSVIAGRWLTSVDSTTRALDENRQVMLELQAEYDKVVDKTGEWKKNLDGISVAKLDSALRNLNAEYDALFEKASSGLIIVDPRVKENVNDARNSIISLNESLRLGIIDARQYRVSLDKIYSEAQNDDARKFIKVNLDLAMQLEKVASESVKTGKEAVELGSNYEGAATAANRLAHDISGTVTSLKNQKTALDDAKTSAEKYQTALETMAKFVPELKAELDKVANLESVRNAFQNMAFNEITPELARNSQQAVNNINATFDEQTNRAMRDAFDSNRRVSNSLLETARKFTGLNENNPSDNVTLQQLFKNANMNVDPKVTAWCAAFVNAVLATQGLPSSANPTLARSFLDYGEATTDPKPGDLVVLKRGDSDWQGHVGFFAGYSDDGNVRVVGGNQSNQVGEDTYKAEDVLGFRRVPGQSEVALEQIKKINEEERKRTEEMQRQAEATTKALEDMGLDIENQKLILDGKEREAAIEEGLRKLRENDPNISAEQLEIARQRLGTLYDLKNQTSELEEIERRINELETHRNALLEQRRVYEEQGNFLKVEEIDAELAGINMQLTEAIDKAIAFHQAIGGSSADASIAKLNSMKLGVQNVGAQSLITAQQVNQSVANGLVNAFDRMAQAIANGENALEALGDALLQFVAESLIELGKLILRWAFLRMLEGMGFGGMIAGAVNGVTVGRFHEGGVVGSSSDFTIANPAWFRNARRMHNGGIVGLKSNEIPTILEEGETVRTEDQEASLNRSRGSSSSPVNLKIVNAFDAGEMVNEAMNTEPGEQAMLNWMGKNSSVIKETLGV